MQRAYDMIIHDMALQNLPVAPLHGPRRPQRRRRPDAPRPLRHRLPPPRPRTSSTCSRRMRTNSWTCSGRWRTTTTAPSPSATRAASAPARSRRTQPKLLEIGKAEVVADGTDVALIGLGTMFEMAERTKALLEAQGPLRRAHQPALDQAARRRRASRRFARKVQGRLHLRGSRPAQRLRLRASSSTSTTPASTPRSCASAGRMNSSSTANPTPSANSTASPPKPRRKRCCGIFLKG